MGNAISLVKDFVDHHLFLKAAILDFAIQWLFVPITFHHETGTFFDLVGSSTFLYLSWVTLMWSKRGTGLPFSRRQIMQNFCVSVWATRLGTFLHSRRHKRNGRFEKAKENPGVCFKFWTIQGIWIYCTLIPTFILNNKLIDKPLNAVDYVGFGLWTFGFLIEAIADNQKRVFLDNPENRGKFITSGLWSVSRHPNYLGEIILWCGLFLPVVNMIEDGVEYLSILSPLSVVYLLTNVSGVPYLERRADQRWGNLVEYQMYKNRTAKLCPFIW